MRIPRARYAVPFALLLVFCGLILAAPAITRYLLAKVLSDQLQVPVVIETVSLNLFRGKAEISNLLVTGEQGSGLQGARLYADVDMKALILGDLVAEAVVLEGVRLNVVRSPGGETVIVLPLGGSDETDADSAVELPLFELRDFRLVKSQVDIDLPPVRGLFTVDSLRLESLGTLRSAPASLALKADWNGAELTVDGTLAAFEEAPWFEGEFALQRAKLAELNPFMPAPLAGLGGTAGLRWQGRLSTESVALAVQFELEQGAVGLSNLQIESTALSFRGDVEAEGLAAAPLFSLAGEVAGAGLSVTDASRNIILFDLAALDVEGLRLDDHGRLAVARVDFDDMRAVDRGGESRRLLQGRDLQVRELEFHDNQLAVEAISVEDVVSTVQITAEGDLVSRGVLSTSLEGLLESREDAEESPPLKWRVGSTSVRNSRITLIDQQFETPLEIELLMESMVLGELDSRYPDESAPLSVRARIGEYGRIDMDGRIASLNPVALTEVKGRVDALELQSVSPYMEHLLGYELVAGQFDHDFDLNITDAHIVASNELHLRKVRVEKLEDAQPVAPLPMPLGFALDLLRDNDDHIELSVPLEGQLDDPDFGLDQAISRALGKALQAGSTTYLKLALQPYGAIWMGAEMGIKLAGKVRLDPMTFAAGSATLGEVQADYANKLATILTDKPDIHLELCGWAGREDFESLVQQEAQADGDTLAATAEPPGPAEQLQQMLALAEARVNALKRWLVNQKGISASRLYPCKPAADPQGELGGVRLSL